MHGDFSNSDLPSNLAEQGRKQQPLMFWESLGQLDFVPDVEVFDRCSLSLGGNTVSSDGKISFIILHIYTRYVCYIIFGR